MLTLIFNLKERTKKSKENGHKYKFGRHFDTKNINQYGSERPVFTVVSSLCSEGQSSGTQRTKRHIIFHMTEQPIETDNCLFFPRRFYDRKEMEFITFQFSSCKERYPSKLSMI